MVLKVVPAVVGDKHKHKRGGWNHLDKTYKFKFKYLPQIHTLELTWICISKELFYPVLKVLKH